MSLSEMRKSYTLHGLEEKDVVADPVVQFQTWFREANQPDLPDWFEANAMTLSTAVPGSDGAMETTSRIVLLKGIEEGRFQFFTNYDSIKGLQIAANPNVALCFFWPHVQRQVRIEGKATKTDRKTSERYFASRPRESQLGAHVSLQSSTIDSRQWLEDRMADLQKQYSDRDVPCPENWGGYEVVPRVVEFWQGRPSRLHDRICYRRDGDQWKTVRLSP